VTVRTLTTQEAAVLAAPDGYSVHTRVWLWNGAAWVDVTNLEGRDWLVSVAYDESIDQPCAQAKVELRRRLDRLSLNPLVGNKLAGTLALGRAFYVETATVPLGDPPQDSDWREVFRGQVEELSLDKDPLTFGGRDLGGPLIRTFIEVADREYGSDAGTPLETVLQAILTDNGTGVTLSAPSTGVMLGRFKQKRESVMSAIRNLALRCGWDVRYRWDEGSGLFRLTLFLPPRTATTPVWTWQPYAYEEVTRAEQSVHDIRNVVSVTFYDKNDPGPDGLGKLKEVVRTDATSVAAYGRAYMQLAEGTDSPIKTLPEAITLADSALADLKEPLLNLSASCEYLYAAQLGDMHTFAANGEHFTTAQTLAVVGLAHELTQKGAYTTVQVRGQPAGAHADWLRRETRVTRGPDLANPAAPSLPTLTPIAGGVVVTFAPPAISPRPAAYELHLSTTSGFTLSSSTLKAVSATTRFEVADLAPGGTYYVRVVSRDAAGNRSGSSTEVSFVAGRTNLSTSTGNLPAGVGQSDGLNVRVLAKGHVSGQARQDNPLTDITFPVSYQNPPLVLFRGGLNTEPRAMWGPNGTGEQIAAEQNAFRSGDPVYDDTSALNLTASGFTLRARLKQKGSQTPQNADADVQTNNLTAVGQTATATLVNAPSGASGDSYTVHFKVSVTATAGGGTWLGPVTTTVDAVLAIDSSVDGGSTWAERWAATYTATRTATGAGSVWKTESWTHEAKTLAVSGLSSNAPADKFRLRVKSITVSIVDDSPEQSGTASGTVSAHLFHRTDGDPAAALTYSTASADQYASKTPDSDDYIYWEALEVS
jgi:hypothetical protein